MNAKQAFEEAAKYHDAKALASLEQSHRSFTNEAFERANGAESAHEVSAAYFTRRASEVEAEDAAWTAEVRRLALIVRDAKPGAHPFRDARDAALLATLVLNILGEKP